MEESNPNPGSGLMELDEVWTELDSDLDSGGLDSDSRGLDLKPGSELISCSSLIFCLFALRSGSSLFSSSGSNSSPGLIPLPGSDGSVGLLLELDLVLSRSPGLSSQFTFGSSLITFGPGSAFRSGSTGSTLSPDSGSGSVWSGLDSELKSGSWSRLGFGAFCFLRLRCKVGTGSGFGSGLGSGFGSSFGSGLGSGSGLSVLGLGSGSFL